MAKNHFLPNRPSKHALVWQDRSFGDELERLSELRVSQNFSVKIRVDFIISTGWSKKLMNQAQKILSSTGSIAQESWQHLWKAIHSDNFCRHKR